MTAPKLSPELAAQLAAVPTSRDLSFHYAPCRVELKSGDILPRVYLAEESAHLRLWGDDPGRPMVDLDDVAGITESPERLPPQLADAIYDAGESGMGYVVFTVRMRDGRTIPFSTGNAVDFLDWPADVDPQDAVAVEPHAGRAFVGRDSGGHRGASYLWCLYSV